MESIISTFHIDWKIIIAQMINFGVVFVVLYVFALKPLSKLMAERGDKISKGLEDAKNSATMLEKSYAEYDQALFKARIEANQIFEETKKEAESTKASMLESAKAEVKLTIDNGKKALEEEKSRMLEESKGEIVSLVMQTTQKLLAQSMNPNFNEKTIEELKNL